MILHFSFIAGESRSADREKAIAEEKRKLQGSWRIVSIEGEADVDGKVVYSREMVERASGHHFKFDDYLYIEAFPHGIRIGHYQVDPSKNPKELDYEYTPFGKMKAVYSLNGDTMKIRAVADSRRPTSLDDKEGQISLLYTLERQK